MDTASWETPEMEPPEAGSENDPADLGIHVHVSMSSPHTQSGDSKGAYQTDEVVSSEKGSAEVESARVLFAHFSIVRNFSKCISQELFGKSPMRTWHHRPLRLAENVTPLRESHAPQCALAFLGPHS